MNSITDIYIDSLYDLSRSDFPASVILQAKKCLLDYLGVTLAGAKIQKEKGSLILNSSGNKKGEVPVIGFERKSNLYCAALLNGMSAHIAELDDGIRHGIVHPGSSIISALLPIALQYKLHGIDLLRGIIIGYESVYRLTTTIQPSHRNKGYHATGSCGTIGVALGVGAALGFSRQQLKDALSAAATSASGMLKVTKGSSELKPFNAGQAAVAGIIATLTSQAGYNGPDDVLEGEWGFINMMAEKSNLPFLGKKNDDKLGIEKVYFKPYAACRHSHSAIEAALEIKRKYKIEPEQIVNVDILTYFLAVKGHDHTEINGITEAKMSTPYNIAVALITGKAGIEEYSEKMINNQQIINLTKKVNVKADDAINSLVPEKRPAVVNITTLDNSTYAFRVDLAKGEPEIPLTEKEMTDKFKSLATFGGKTENEIYQIILSVWNLEKDISKLIKYIS